MRAPVFAIACLWLPVLSAPASDWPGASYREVRAFAYNKSGFPDLPIVEKDHLSRTVLDHEGVVLAAGQVKRLLEAVTGRRPAPKWTTLCFNPRHAFVFYDAAHRPVAWVELCFECSGARAQPFRRGQVYDIPALEALASELKLPLVPQRPNQAMQPTPGRRTLKLSMTPTSSPAATRALASGG